MFLEQTSVTRGKSEGRSTFPVELAYVSRFRRLTSREVRLLLLAVQDGLSYRELGEALGITRGNVARTMQAIRRKLAVPRMQDLGSFVRSNPTLAATVFGPRPARGIGETRTEERRRQDLLRVTLDELKAVAIRASRRAASLEALPVLDDDPVSSEPNEAPLIRQMADLIDAAAVQALAVVRGRGCTSSP